jgi:D-threo-aldose 1-dehydrogenase
MSFALRTLGRSGLRLTSLGFGGGPVGWRQTPDADGAAEALLDDAWRAGIRYYDTAPFYGYGDSERRLGRSLARHARDDYILSTKVGRLIRPGHADERGAPVVFDYSHAGTLRSIEESLERLGIGRIDIALIHDIDATHGEAQPRRFREALDGAYPALADLKAQGAIRAIGLGVNEWPVCEAFAREVPVDCVLLAGQHSLLRQEALARFLPFCAQRGIGVIIGGPFNSGILASGPVPGALFDYAPASLEIRARVRRIAAVCARYGVALPAAALAFTLRHPAVSAVIPGFADAQELSAGLDWARAAVPDGLWKALRAECLIAPEAAP